VLGRTAVAKVAGSLPAGAAWANRSRSASRMFMGACLLVLS